jgi:ABC-type ATPase with predicted acetyltransferase domain
MKWFSKNKHEHFLEIIDVEHAEYWIGSGPVTVVLYRCKECGNSWTRNLDGWWTKAQLQGKSK